MLTLFLTITDVNVINSKVTLIFRTTLRKYTIQTISLTVVDQLPSFFTCIKKSLRVDKSYSNVVINTWMVSLRYYQAVVSEHNQTRGWKMEISKTISDHHSRGSVQEKTVCVKCKLIVFLQINLKPIIKIK